MLHANRTSFSTIINYSLVEDPNRIRFSGKGAGAGMMLMSTLGPTGIAVGIAIDEGIGKEIDERAKAGQVNIERILQEQLAKELAKTSIKYPPKTEIVIQRYGFLSSSENRDNVLPQLHLVIISDGQKRTLKYPEDYKEVASNPPSAPLEHVKSDAEVIEELLNKTAHFLVGEMISLY